MPTPYTSRAILDDKIEVKVKAYVGNDYYVVQDFQGNDPWCVTRDRLKFQPERKA